MSQLSIGDIRKNHQGKQILVACLDCGREAWVYLKNGKPRSLRCQHCNGKRVTSNQHGENHHKWAGGVLSRHGYKFIYVKPESWLFPMADNKHYISEHRIVIALSLGRCLDKSELVHHKNGIKDDNRLENLTIVSRNNHKGEIECPYCRKTFQMK